MLKFNWDADWSAAQAIARLCIDPEVYGKAGSNLAQRIEPVLQSALDGVMGRLNEDRSHHAQCV